MFVSLAVMACLSADPSIDPYADKSCERIKIDTSEDFHNEGVSACGMPAQVVVQDWLKSNPEYHVRRILCTIGNQEPRKSSAV